MRKAIVLAVVVLMFAPVLAFGQDYEPPNETPSWIVSVLNAILDFFAPKYVVPFSAAMGTLLITIVGFMRQILAWFGAKLSAKQIYFATGVLSFLTALGGFAADGQLAGDEVWVLAATILSLIAAAFGYKLAFSGDARARLGK